MLVEPDEEPALKKALGEIAILKAPATADSPIYINYDHKLAGTAATNPKQRIPPFREAHLTKCLRAWMEHRGGGQPEDPLHIADEYVLTDGGKPGLHKDLTKIFKNKQHEVKLVTMMYMRDDVKACREKTKGGAVNQIEGKLHITQATTTTTTTTTTIARRFLTNRFVSGPITAHPQTGTPSASFGCQPGVRLMR